MGDGNAYRLTYRAPELIIELHFVRCPSRQPDLQMPALCTDPHVRARLAYLQMADELSRSPNQAHARGRASQEGLRD